MKAEKKHLFLSGDEAVARGAYESGALFAAGYPGTPSTEILESMAQYEEIYANWSVNEKVALEEAIGASLAGARAMAIMKHVGLNVAADPFFTSSYIGTRAGLVVVSCDDPGMHSSQNEQDNRHLAKAAKIPILEPSDSQEAKDFVSIAMALSEEFETPVMLRLTTRICHSYGLVEEGPRLQLPEPVGFVQEPRRFVMIPQFARERHKVVEERMKKLKAFSESFEHHRREQGQANTGIISSGVAYQYAKEVCPEASFLKIAMTYPLPEGLIRGFAQQVETVWVVEELDPFMEEQIKALGIRVRGKDSLPLCGELNPSIVRHALKKEADSALKPLSGLPSRPPVMCPGCPHRAMLYVLKTFKVPIIGDIGCYTLGGTPPLDALDSCVCMGASIGMSLGMEKVWGKGKVVAALGDSTFLHSGITPLIDIVYNQGATLVVILDNGTTAMTGHQDHPGTGKTLKGMEVQRLRLEKLISSLGIEDIKRVNPFHVEAARVAVADSLKRDEPSVIITTEPCTLMLKVLPSKRYIVDQDLCVSCGLCGKLGCPALRPSKEGKAPSIDVHLCKRCGLCSQVCKTGAILETSSG